MPAWWHSAAAGALPARAAFRRRDVDHPTRQLAEFISALDFSRIPAPVVDKMRECLLDFIGVSSVAYLAESTPVFFRGIGAIAGEGDATVIGSSRTLPYQYAAMLNGTLAHTSDFDDTNAIGGGHLGAPVIAAALAAAERWGASGADFLAGTIAGYETMVRVGTGLGVSAYERGFHPTAVDGVFGATAAVCRVARADATVTEDALGLALSMAAGSMQYLENGAWNKRLHPGLAAYHGNLAHALAREGVLGAALPLEGKFGLLRGYSDRPDPAWLNRELGSRWYTLNTAIKPYPSCRFAHGAIDAIRQLQAEQPVDIDAVERIEVTISPTAFEIVGDSRPNKTEPNNVVDAQFSLFFQLGAAFIDGTVVWDSYRLIGDPRLARLAGKVHIAQQEGFTKLQTVLTRVVGGQRRTTEIRLPIGDDQNPLPWADIMAKFDSNIACRFDAARARRIVESVRDELAGCADAKAWIRETLRGDRP